MAAFDDVVVAISPPQAQPDTTMRRVEIYRFDVRADTRLSARAHHPPAIRGDPTVTGRESRPPRALDHQGPVRARRRVVQLDRLATPADPPNRHAGRGHLPRHQRRLSVADRTVDRIPRPRGHGSLHHRMQRHRRSALDCSWHEPRRVHGCARDAQPVEFTGVSMYRVEDGGSPRSGTPATPSASCTNSTPTSQATATTTEPHSNGPSTQSSGSEDADLAGPPRPIDQTNPADASSSRASG